MIGKELSKRGLTLTTSENQLDEIHTDRRKGISAYRTFMHKEQGGSDFIPNNAARLLFK